jgi:hypothetical protein
MHAAVFVDFENLFASLQNRAELSGQRTRELALSILENLVRRLHDEDCPLVLGRSYAAFDTFPGMEVAHDLALMGFDPQYVLVSPSGKNSADVQLAVDVCRVLFRRPDIEAIVIVAGDRDFIPIARQVLEENRELRLVAIPEVASGDLRMRVGGERFWNALDLLPPDARRGGPVPAEPMLSGPIHSGPIHSGPIHSGQAPEPAPHPEPLPEPDPEPAAAAAPAVRAAVVGHIPVTWRTTADAPVDALQQKLEQVVDLLVRTQIRHSSHEIWLSPFLKGPMSQHFSGLVHPERRALINELRNRGAIRIEERENLFADHPYSVIVLEDGHPLAKAALDRHLKA